MLTVPDRSAEETRANATFDALLWALTRPGHVRRLPEDTDAAIIEALIDRECRVHSADALLLPQILRTGAELTGIDAADHVFFGRLEDVGPLGVLRLGSDLYPDDGATVVLRGEIGTGTPLRFTGPGVDGQIEVALGGLPTGFWDRRADLIRYPMGFDLFVRDGVRIVGVPRSTTVEVL